MASSSGDPDSLVLLRLHDFRAERMRHWWTLLGGDDHASIMGIFGKFPSLMRLREYAGLLQLDSPFSEMPVIPIQGPRSNRVLGEVLGFDFRAELTKDFIAGERRWKKFRTNAFKIAFAGIFLFPTSAGRIDLGVIPLIFSKGKSIIPAILCETVRSLSYCRRQGKGVPMFCKQLLQLWFCSHLRYFYRLQTPYHFERHTVRQTVDTALLFTSNSRDWVLYLLDLPLSEWSWKDVGLHKATILAFPFVSLAAFRTLPCLGDLSSVTFDYVPSDNMWRSLSWVESIWGGRCSEMVLVEGGLHADSFVTPDFAEWREEWNPSFTLRPTVQPGVPHSSVPSSLQASASASQSERVADLERELEETLAELASLRLVRASEREGVRGSCGVHAEHLASQQCSCGEPSS
uniref:DUF7745 domain-containing protein n=1 Tax=Fagus sylvatica TaxID=28930 RepID=A0A2N9G4C1_FAGSY